MSKVCIKNVSKSKMPLSLNFKDHSSTILSYGNTFTVDEKLLTPYIYRRSKAGDFTINKVVDQKMSIKKKVEEESSDNNKKEVK